MHLSSQYGYSNRRNQMIMTKMQTPCSRSKIKDDKGCSADAWIGQIPFIKVCEQKQFWAACTCLSYNPSMIDSPLSKLTAPYSIYSPLEHVHACALHICRHIWCSWPSLRWSVLCVLVNWNVVEILNHYLLCTYTVDQIFRSKPYSRLKYDWSGPCCTAVHFDSHISLSWSMACLRW